MRKYVVPQSNTLTYLMSDHLGSTSLTTDTSGNLLVETRYKPWGEVRYTTPSQTLPTQYTFTGQYSYVADDATDLGNAGFGLMFYNARWYDPSLGRFAQADTIIPQQQGVQAWDRYAYANNNPLYYTDPSGHIPVDCYGTNYCGTSNSDLLPDFKPSKPKDERDDDLLPQIESEDSCNVGHCYETTNTVCPAEFNCTAEQMQEYAAMFQYPGQMPWNPVLNGYSYFVFPATLLASRTGIPLLLLSGAINVTISDDGLTLTNRSEFTHIFHNGQVVRNYTQNADGSWSVTSTGTGTNVWPVIGPAIDQANDAVGTPTFDIVDGFMTTYIYLDQTLVEQASSLFP